MTHHLNVSKKVLYLILYLNVFLELIFEYQYTHKIKKLRLQIG